MGARPAHPGRPVLMQVLKANPLLAPVHAGFNSLVCAALALKTWPCPGFAHRGVPNSRLHPWVAILKGGVSFPHRSLVV